MCMTSVFTAITSQCLWKPLHICIHIDLFFFVLFHFSNKSFILHFVKIVWDHTPTQAYTLHSFHLKPSKCYDSVAPELLGIVAIPIFPSALWLCESCWANMATLIKVGLVLKWAKKTNIKANGSAACPIRGLLRSAVWTGGPLVPRTIPSRPINACK